MWTAWNTAKQKQARAGQQVIHTQVRLLLYVQGCGAGSAKDDKLTTSGQTLVLDCTLTAAKTHIYKPTSWTLAR